MRNFLAIYRKEMQHYFVSPVAYIVGAVFLFIAGFVFRLILNSVIEYSMTQAMQAARFGGPMEFDAPSQVLRGFFGFLGVVALFVLPMLTMGTYAEEKRRGTMELLMTSPLRDIQIVLGKFFASLSFFALLLLPTLAYQVVLFLTSDPAPPWRLMMCGYLGLFLLGGVLIALGSFISSLTESQMIAGVVTFGFFLILWLLDGAAGRATGTLAQVLEYLSLIRNYEDFTRGLVDTTNLVFYGSLIILGIFLTARSIDAMRWQRA